MASVRLSNSGADALCVLVEPLGEDFWIVNGQTLTFAVPDDVPTVSWYENGAAVWVNEGDWHGFVVTTTTGEAVECGVPATARSVRHEQVLVETSGHAAIRAVAVPPEDPRAVTGVPARARELETC